jgi:predicted ABC-type ATPase
LLPDRINPDHPELASFNAAREMLLEIKEMVSQGRSFAFEFI